jgi:hypothetical protein
MLGGRGPLSPALALTTTRVLDLSLESYSRSYDIRYCGYTALHQCHLRLGATTAAAEIECFVALIFEGSLLLVLLPIPGKKQVY